MNGAQQGGPHFVHEAEDHAGGRQVVVDHVAGAAVGETKKLIGSSGGGGMGGGVLCVRDSHLRPGVGNGAVQRDLLAHVDVKMALVPPLPHLPRVFARDRRRLAELADGVGISGGGGHVEGQHLVDTCLNRTGVSHLDDDRVILELFLLFH